ncbi:MAG: alanine--tRNA ligase, partial [bacterium]|nr:alanine--tRNA ligase [bacterium]
FGFPRELIEEELGVDIKAEFEKENKRHQELSRTASAGMFKGGLADQSETVTKYHTATHLLHKALRTVLGDSVHQEGSNLTAERLRFDFTYSSKLTDEELKNVESLVNKAITDNLIQKVETMTYDEAVASGALAFFKEKYPEKVTVYSFGDYSKEICGGPHVENTGILGHFEIFKQEAVSSGIRRIYGKLI